MVERAPMVCAVGSTGTTTYGEMRARRCHVFASPLRRLRLSAKSPSHDGPEPETIRPSAVSERARRVLPRRREARSEEKIGQNRFAIRVLSWVQHSKTGLQGSGAGVRIDDRHLDCCRDGNCTIAAVPVGSGARVAAISRVSLLLTDGGSLG